MSLRITYYVCRDFDHALMTARKFGDIHGAGDSQGALVAVHEPYQVAVMLDGEGGRQHAFFNQEHWEKGGFASCPFPFEYKLRIPVGDVREGLLEELEETHDR